MSKLSRRKNLKSKIEVGSPKIFGKSSKTVHQTDISGYFFKSKQDEEVSGQVGLPECALPSPDDAALPCSTSLGSVTIKSAKVQATSAKDDKDSSVPEEKAQMISDMTNKVINNVSKKKKTKKQTPAQPPRNSQLTDFFPVRRSNRKPLFAVKKEKEKSIEEAILSGIEDGFEIKEFPEKGRGVITTKAIKRNEFVLEYHGELIDYEEALRREASYALKENVGCYMYYFKALNKRYCIDATKESGRLGRLINHSKKGNLKTQPYYFKDRPYLALFACKDIEAGEELCYDYGDRSKQALESHPWLAL